MIELCFNLVSHSNADRRTDEYTIHGPAQNGCSERVNEMVGYGWLAAFTQQLTENATNKKA